MDKISCSEFIWSTLVGKYWKSCKMAKIGPSKSIQKTLVGKYWNIANNADNDANNNNHGQKGDW